ncbi:MAG: DUF4395 domain-containing protein [Dehalococcoidia bacterium]|nr:DUF4395 domain-containing protein [Dehalococcoidia bacterium]
MRQLLEFPDPVNEVAARLVAGGVAVLCAALLLTQTPWLVALLAAGFLARVLSGPRISPLALFVTRVLIPRLPLAERPTPGPPKRFAQGIGATLSLAAVVLHFGLGFTAAAYVLVGMVLVAASLEAFVGFCLGCKIFAILMRVGILPESVCEACADISRRRPHATA